MLFRFFNAPPGAITPTGAVLNTISHRYTVLRYCTGTTRCDNLDAFLYQHRDSAHRESVAQMMPHCELVRFSSTRRHMSAPDGSFHFGDIATGCDVPDRGAINQLNNVFLDLYRTLVPYLRWVRNPRWGRLTHDYGT